MTNPGPAIAALTLTVLPVAIAIAGPAPKPPMRQYDTPFYIIHTDLDIEGVREAAVRMTAMAREYSRRTAGFSGAIRRKLPFFLYRNTTDYYAAGGMPGSAGLYKGDKLMAVAGKKTSSRTWHVVQHEGFHQFAHSVIRGKIPVWVNEGLAEYFGEAIYTGDGFVTGIIPPYRLRRLKRLIEAGDVKNVREMMQMSYKQWVGDLAITNYDMAWSMVHFLVHGDDGKYVKALGAFINDISVSRMRYEQAWAKNFGRDLDAFQKRYIAWWLARGDTPTEDLYNQAAAAIVTSFYARAVGQRKTFDDASEFLAAAESGSLKPNMKDYLPPALLKSALPRARRMGKWAIEERSRLTPLLVCTLPDGRRMEGAFLFRKGIVASVDVKLKDKPKETPDQAPTTRPRTQPTTRPAAPEAKPIAEAVTLARAYLAMGRRDKAAAILRKTLAEDPASPHAAEAKALLAGIAAPSPTP